MSKNSDDLTKETFWSFMKKFPNEPPIEPVFLVWHYHVPTKQLVYEHNWKFYLTKEEYASLPFPLWIVLKKEAFGSSATELFPKHPTTLEGCKAHCEQMQKIVELDVRAIMDYHNKPGCQVRTWKSKEEYMDDIVSVLKKTGEHDPTGEAMYEFVQPKSYSEYPKLALRYFKSLFGY
jgi:hypothetical protein